MADPFDLAKALDAATQKARGRADLAKARAKDAQVPTGTMAGSRPAVIRPRFDAKNVRAARLIKAAGAKLVTAVTQETRVAIRTIVNRAIREGMHPYDAAKLIVGVVSSPGATTNEVPGLVGLNGPQVTAAMNYRSGLIDMGHNQATVDRLMGKYLGRKLRERTEMIARTETMWALNAGAQAGYIQSVKKGWLPSDGMLEWITTPDERLCGLCAPLNGDLKPIGATTTFSDGSVGPPKHPRCRCTVALAVSNATA